MEEKDTGLPPDAAGTAEPARMAVDEPETGADVELPVSDDPDAPPVVNVPDSELALPDPGSEAAEGDELSPEQLLMDVVQPERDDEVARKLAVLEAVVYVTDEPLSAEQIAKALGEPLPDVRLLLDKLVEEYNRPEHGLTVREVAGGFKMATKPEHHEAVRTFVKNLNPPLKLSLAALETLAVIAYKQPITAPEIMEIRGVQGAGVLKTLIERKLITTAGRKNVVGKPILYKTTREFLVQFGLRDLAELPTLKEFEDLRRMAFSETEEIAPPEAEPPADEPLPEEEPAQS